MFSDDISLNNAGLVFVFPNQMLEKAKRNVVSNIDILVYYYYYSTKTEKL